MPVSSNGIPRQYVLAGIVVALGMVTAGILLEVLGTILFALTVAYVLAPVQGWLVRRGFSERTSAVLATLCGFLTTAAVFAPLVLTLYLRTDEIVEIVEGLPPEIPITVFEFTYTVEVIELQNLAIGVLTDVAVAVVTQLPVLAIKFALFVILLFALLSKGEAAGRAAITPVPPAYRDVVFALARRARETLYAIYVLQLATAVSTVLVGYPLFWALGYEMAFTLALLAAILQFVPIIGPSLLIVPIALYHVAAGELLAATLVAVLGMTLVAWFPDVVVRPRLAQRSAGLPGSLYFVGFTGGLFTMGAIGIVVGPLIVAVFVEAVDLLADEINTDASFAELAESNGESLEEADGSRTDPGDGQGVSDGPEGGDDSSGGESPATETSFDESETPARPD